MKTVTLYPDAPDIESSTLDYVRRFSRPVGVWMLGKQQQATRSALQQVSVNGSKLHVLDVGGGHGQNVELVKNLGHYLTVVGSNENCASLIRDDINSERIQFQVSSLLDLPFEDNSFDVVICYRILSHMESMERLISELARVSRRLVLVDYPSKRSLNIFSNPLFSIKKRIEKNTRRFHCYSDGQIKGLFADQGYEKIFESRQFFYRCRCIVQSEV